jgi:hypothetical protein
MVKMVGEVEKLKEEKKEARGLEYKRRLHFTIN